MNDINLDDPRICIDCTGFSREKKKRVQDCFFKLGYMWLGGSYGGYEKLTRAVYTNSFDSGNWDKCLMCDNRGAQIGSEYQHTYEQLLERAGLTDVGGIVVEQENTPTTLFTSEVEDLINKYDLTLGYYEGSYKLYGDILGTDDNLILENKHDLLDIINAVSTISKYKEQ